VHECCREGAQVSQGRSVALRDMPVQRSDRARGQERGGKRERFGGEARVGHRQT
jgi:hypothetical protein